MLKKANQPSELQIRARIAAEKEEKIKAMVLEIDRSKKKQAELIVMIELQRKTIEERENTLASPHGYTSLDLDIRNSQLVSGVELERKRWLEAEQQQIIEVLGEEEELKSKFEKLRAEQKPEEKAKLLTLMKKKLQLLQNLSKLKPQSALLVSHQRVLLKQYLEDIRLVNTELEDSNKRYANLPMEHSRAVQKLRNTVNDLKEVISSTSSQGQQQ